MDVSAISYRTYVEFALEETRRHTQLLPSPLQKKFNSLTAIDQKTDLQMVSFESPKIRLVRSLLIEGNGGMQVLDFAIFPRPDFDLPIFCANFFTSPSSNIAVLDLNPLYDVVNRKDYKDKYYKGLMDLADKYAEILPWGGKITGESLKFFSPIVIWTKFTPCQDKHDALYSAFKDYLKTWLGLMENTDPDADAFKVIGNREAQHRYLTWRAEKDPGFQMLRRLIGENGAKDLVRNFLFSGSSELGSKGFLDYFPEYRAEDGTVNRKRSIIGKSFEHRPWDSAGEFTGGSLNFEA